MKNRHLGFTLIELMITLLLSSMLIAAIGKVFIDSGNAFRKQKTLSYLVEDGRYAQLILAKELRRAGFLRSKHATGGLPKEIFIKDDNVFGSGINLAPIDPPIDARRDVLREFIKGSFNKTGFAGDSFDINHLVIRYQLNDKSDLSTGATPFDASPCTEYIHLTAGEDPAKQKIVVTLFFQVNFDKKTNAPVLYCTAKRRNLDFPADNKRNPTSVAIPLISNVERLYVLYGVDTVDDKVAAANQYLRADQVTNWVNVVSTRIFLVLASEDKYIAYKAPSYSINGHTYTVTSPADKRIYKVFTTTIAMRNRL